MIWLDRNWHTSAGESKLVALCPVLRDRHGSKRGLASLKGAVRAWVGAAASCPEGRCCLGTWGHWAIPSTHEQGSELEFKAHHPVMVA